MCFTGAPLVPVSARQVRLPGATHESSQSEALEHMSRCQRRGRPSGSPDREGVRGKSGAVKFTPRPIVYRTSMRVSVLSLPPPLMELVAVRLRAGA